MCVYLISSIYHSLLSTVALTTSVIRSSFLAFASTAGCMDMSQAPATKRITVPLTTAIVTGVIRGGTTHVPRLDHRYIGGKDWQRKWFTWSFYMRFCSFVMKPSVTRLFSCQNARKSLLWSSFSASWPLMVLHWCCALFRVTTFHLTWNTHFKNKKRNVPLIDLRYVHIVIVRAGHVHNFKLLMNDRLCKT